MKLELRFAGFSLLTVVVPSYRLQPTSKMSPNLPAAGPMPTAAMLGACLPSLTALRRAVPQLVNAMNCLDRCQHGKMRSQLTSCAQLINIPFPQQSWRNTKSPVHAFLDLYSHAV